jgi:hypothetical protein
MLQTLGVHITKDGHNTGGAAERKRCSEGHFEIQMGATNCRPPALSFVNFISTCEKRAQVCGTFECAQKQYRYCWRRKKEALV